MSERRAPWAGRILTYAVAAVPLVAFISLIGS
jgi:hypothetical protein